jgi:hypothetical protein
MTDGGVLHCKLLIFGLNFDTQTKRTKPDLNNISKSNIHESVHQLYHNQTPIYKLTLFNILVIK